MVSCGQPMSVVSSTSHPSPLAGGGGPVGHTSSLLASLSGVPGGHSTSSLLGNTSTSGNSQSGITPSPSWVSDENTTLQNSPERNAGGSEHFHPIHPPILGHPRGPPGPAIRGITRGSIRGPTHGSGPMPDFAPFLRPMPLRPPFFIREIYKNGFLKRLPYNEKKSSALAKLMKSDRFWVVFSIHDDVHPFLELWHEPTEVASKPPQYIFPLAACQHISPSIIPADSEWSFVINFDTVAIRFSCNSREVMDDWVDVIRNKLSEMGILNPKGNLYSRTPLGPPVTKPVIRDPTSPLPQPPESQPVSSEITIEPTASASDEVSNTSNSPRKSEDTTPVAKSKKSSIDTNAGQHQTFTTSIYLNQTPPATPKSPTKPQSSLIVNRKTSLPVCLQTKTKVTSSKSVSVSQSTTDVKICPSGTESVAISSGTAAQNAAGSTSSVYLNQSSPTRHVTVIPINNISSDVDETSSLSSSKQLGDSTNQGSEETLNEQPTLSDSVEYENHTYGAIFDFDEKNIARIQPEKEKTKPVMGDNHGNMSPRKQEHSPRRGRERTRSQAKTEEPPPLPHRPVLRRLSERKHEVTEGKVNIHQKIRRKSRRSSSLGPLLDAHNLPNGDIGASTLSLESVDSNPRQAVPKSDRNLGAVPRRPLPPGPRYTNDSGENPPSPTHPLLGSPPRNINDLPPGIRPPPYHPLAALSHPNHPPAQAGFPPMIPLPGLTCQLSIPPGMSLPPVPADERAAQRSVREQQVMRLRQEIGHPAGVRLQLRKKDCQSSLALVDLFGCVWVVGWKQREYPVLYNAFHIGDQILSVSGVLIRSSSEFTKLVKLKSGDLHTEIIIRRVPFGQVFHLKPDIEGQSLGIIPYNSTPEIKEIIPGSIAAQAGVNGKIRSFDGQTVVPLVITEINGRPVNMLSKDGEAWERLSGTREAGRDISVLLQPSDIVGKFKKQLKSVRGYKDYLLC